MATKNPFDLLGDVDSDDPTQLIAAQEQKSTAKKPSASAAPPPAAAKLPSKPAPPAQAVREARSSTAPTRGGPGRGRGGRGVIAGQSRDFGNGNGGGYSGAGAGAGAGYSGVGGEDVDVSRPAERGRGPRHPYRGGRRGGYGNEGEAGDELGQPPRRLYDRKSGTGRGDGMKRDGAGRGNWGIVTDEPVAQEAEETVDIEEKSAVAEKKAEGDAPFAEDKDNKEGESKEAEEKEPEDKEMTLDEYEKVKEEKRKALLALKAEERKVEIDKELQSMQQLSLKKGNDEVFIMLGSSDKETQKKKESVERDERAKKSLSINEFLKPPEGERYYSPGGRGRGRGRGERGPFRGGFGGSTRGPTAAPSIEDQEQFPTLGGK